MAGKRRNLWLFVFSYYTAAKKDNGTLVFSSDIKRAIQCQSTNKIRAIDFFSEPIQTMLFMHYANYIIVV